MSKFLFFKEFSNWVKVRFTTWYSHFLMTQYNDSQWIEHFRIGRGFVIHLFSKLKHSMEKNIHYQCVVLVGIWVTCSLYKLTHRDEKLLQCNELFAINKSIVHLALQELTVFAMNIVFKNKIMWLEREHLVKVMVKFKSFCGLPSIHGTIDVTQIHVLKFQGQSIVNYISFKSKGYNMQLQVIGDYHKKIGDIFVGMLRSMNNTQILQISNLYQRAMHGDLFQKNRGEKNIWPYIYGDKGYPLLPWLIWFCTNKLETWNILGALFNKHLIRGKSVVEIVFRTLKKTFRELILKTNLHIPFVLIVVVCCCILYNMIIDGKDFDL